MYLKTNPLWLYCYKLKISKIPYDQRFEGYSMRLRLRVFYEIEVLVIQKQKDVKSFQIRLKHMSRLFSFFFFVCALWVALFANFAIVIAGLLCKEIW